MDFDQNGSWQSHSGLGVVASFYGYAIPLMMGLSVAMIAGLVIAASQDGYRSIISSKGK